MAIQPEAIMPTTRQSIAFISLMSIAFAAGAHARIAQTKAAPAGPVEACSLLTKEDAAAALGEAVAGPRVTPARSSAGRTASACEYTGSGTHRVHLNLYQFTPEIAAAYKPLCAQKNHDGLAGLGEMSCWYNDKHEELQVLKGTTFFSIQLSRSGNPTEAITALAKKVVGQIH